MTTKLYHYSCIHSRDGIVESGHLFPGAKLQSIKARTLAPNNRIGNMVAQMVWLTDLASITGINRNMVGLTMNKLDCDRTAYRFEVIEDGTPIFQWAELRERWPVDIVLALETLPGAKPAHWFVSRGPVAAKLSPNHG